MYSIMQSTNQATTNYCAEELQNEYSAQSFTWEELADIGLLKKVIKAYIAQELTSNIEINAEELKHMEHRFARLNRLTSDSALIKYKVNNGLTQKGLENQISMEWRIFRFCEKNYSSFLEDKFIELKPMLDKITYRAFRVATDNLANELGFRLRDDKQQFGDIIKEYEADHKEIKISYHGPIALGKIFPEIRNQLVSANVGFITGPIAFENHFVIIEVLAKQVAELNEETVKTIYFGLFEEKVENMVQECLRTNVLMHHAISA